MPTINPLYAYWFSVIINIAISIWFIVEIYLAIKSYKKKKRELKRNNIATATITCSFETANYIRKVISSLPLIYLETTFEGTIEFKVQGDAPVMEQMNRMLIEGALTGEWRP